MLNAVVAATEAEVEGLGALSDQHSMHTAPDSVLTDDLMFEDMEEPVMDGSQRPKAPLDNPAWEHEPVGTLRGMGLLGGAATGGAGAAQDRVSCLGKSAPRR